MALAWVRTQFNNSTSGDGTTVSFTFNFGAAWTAGHGLGGHVWEQNAVTGSVLSSVSDNASNTYSVLNTGQNAAGIAVSLFGLAVVPGSPTTLTITFNTAPANIASNIFIWADEISGASSIDKHALFYNSTTTTTPTSGSVTTTAADLVLGFTTPDTVSSVVSAGAGYTLRLNTSGLFSESELQGSAGAIAATFGFSPGDVCAVGLIAFAPPAVSSFIPSKRLVRAYSLTSIRRP